MRDADAASGSCHLRGLGAESSPATNGDTRDQEGEDEEGIERKERMRTIGQKPRVWRRTIGMGIVTLMVCWGQATPVKARSAACREACSAACREARRVHRRGAVHRMPRPGEQAFQRDAACEGLPAESEERPVSGRAAKPATDRARITPGTRSTRPRSSGSPSVGERRWTCRMASA